jgi:hypothetical protein
VVSRTGATKFGCLVYLLVAAGALYVGIPAGETYMRYLEYRDSMRQEVRFRANLSSEKIKAHLALVADSLGLPEDAGDVDVTREGNRITVEADYDEVLKLPGFKKQIHYHPTASDTY